MINHSGFCTRSLSGWGSRRDSHLVPSASEISSLVRWRMKTGLPLHLMMTCATAQQLMLLANRLATLTFLPSGMASRSISTLAWARTSAEADMLTRKSDRCQISHSSNAVRHHPNPWYIAPRYPSSDAGVLPTLHGVLRAHGGQRTHRANHEVLEDLVAGLTTA